MVENHPAFLTAAHGRSTFEWLNDGALPIWRFEWECPGPPSDMSVIGHDDTDKACCMLYSDERGGGQDISDEFRRPRLEDVEKFAWLLTTHDGQNQR